MIVGNQGHWILSNNPNNLYQFLLRSLLQNYNLVVRVDRHIQEALSLLSNKKLFSGSLLTQVKVQQPQVRKDVNVAFRSLHKFEAVLSHLHYLCPNVVVQKFDVDFTQATTEVHTDNIEEVICEDTLYEK